MPRLFAAISICLLFAVLSGCGNKGPLTLPADTDNQASTVD